MKGGSLLEGRKVYISFGVVCILLGIMLSQQLRSTSIDPSNNGAYRVPELTARLNGVMKERDILAAEVVSLREQLIKRGTMDEEMISLALAAGQLPGQGAGIQVVVNDSAAKISDDPNDYIVHASDLQYLVNELKAGGAEAIAINGERITATSEIRCAGTTILVNLNRVVPPFIIDCVGDPEKLKASLSIPGGWMDTMQIFSLRVDINEKPDIAVPASKTPIKYEYLKPVTKAD